MHSLSHRHMKLDKLYNNHITRWLSMQSVLSHNPIISLKQLEA